MKNLLPLLSFVLLAACVHAQNYSGPESVEFYKPNHHYYISNTQSHVILERDGAGTLSTFASGLVNGPHGLEIINDTLYACSGANLKAFQIPGGTLLYTVNTGATFLNGITHDTSGNIFATDFSGNKVYRINTKTHLSNVFVTGLTLSPNGIVYDSIDNKLVMVNWGNNAPVIAISLQDSSTSTLTSTTLDNCDGIIMTSLGEFIISSWGQNACNLFDHAFTSAMQTIVTGLHSPADLGYNNIGDTLAIPNSANNTIQFFALHQPNNIEQITQPQLQLQQSNHSIKVCGMLSGYLVCLFDVNGRMIACTHLDSIALPSDILLPMIVSVFDEKKNLLLSEKVM